MNRSGTQCVVTRRCFLEGSVLAGVLGTASVLPVRAQENKTAGRQLITVGVVQQAREPQLLANGDKIIGFIGQT